MVDFAEIARNLLTLEVNTVVKEGMSAQKMPTPTNALIDLVLGYHRFGESRPALRRARGGDGGVGGGAVGDVSLWPPALPRHGAATRRAEAGGARMVSSREPDGLRPGDLDRLREVALWLSHMRLRALALAEGHAVEPVMEERRRRCGWATWKRRSRRRRPRRHACCANRCRGAEPIRHNCDQLKGVRSESGRGPALLDPACAATRRWNWRPT